MKVRIEQDAIVNAVFDEEGTMLESWVTLLDDRHAFDADTDIEIDDNERHVNWDFAIRTGQIV